jgi:Fic family protein
VEVLVDATQRYGEPVTAERLFGWHAALFPTGLSGGHRITVGAWRRDETGPMRVVSGALGAERVHFEAPAAQRVADEMTRFLEWFNAADTADPVLRAAVAHFWFVTIHPFDDGNGRIARAIADLALARSDARPERFYSMSSQIREERADYYRQLELSQRGSTEITAWLDWFLGCLGRAIAGAEVLLERVLHAARVWELVNGFGPNDRQRAMVTRMLGPDWEGHMTTSKYAKLVGCSTDTALRDISAMVGTGLLVRNRGGGRSVSYRLPERTDER